MIHIFCVIFFQLRICYECVPMESQVMQSGFLVSIPTILLAQFGYQEVNIF